MALEKELETYKANTAILHEHMGKFVLIKGDQIVDYFASYEDALKAGYQQFQLEPFLVKQITTTIEAIQHITRRVMPHTQARMV